jgi:hypothetical protein
MGTDIWSERIQELVLSGVKENIILAYSLIEDKQLLIFWTWLDEESAEYFKLPFITLQVARELAAINKTIPFFNNHREYIQNAYNKRMEQADSSNGTVT